MAVKRGKTVPKTQGDSVRFEGRFDRALYERLRVMSEREGLSLNRIVRAAVLMACEQYEAGELGVRFEADRFFERSTRS